MKAPGNIGELIELLADLGIQSWDPSAKSSHREPPSRPLANNSRYLPIATRRLIWRRAQGRCEFREAKTGARCPSRWALQLEHKIPYALGGGHDPENLELLCRSHNQLRAVEVFGAKKVEKFQASGGS